MAFPGETGGNPRPGGAVRFPLPPRPAPPLLPMKTLLFLLLPVLPAAARPADDLATLMAELETRLDDADEERIHEVAELGTRESAEALVGLYDELRSVYMRREVVRALPAYDGVPEAEQPALQKLMDVATGAQSRELRDAALEALARCRNRGKAFLRMVVESPAQDEVREDAMRLHVERHDDSDLTWYRELYEPPRKEEDDDDDRRGRRGKDEEEAEPEPVVHPLQSLRVLAFGALAGELPQEELLEAFAEDPNVRIKVAAVEELARRDYSRIEGLATEVLDDISLPARMRVSAAEILARKLGPEVADHFIDLAEKQEVTQDALRRRMAELLADLRDEDVDSRTEKLIGRGKPHERLFALLASRYNEEEKVVRKLVRSLGERDDRVWRLAVEIATERRFEDALPELEKQLGRARRDEDRLALLLTAITSIRDEGEEAAEWREILEEHAVGEERVVRNAALRALSEVGGPGAREILTRALSHEDWSTRLRALRGLESLRDPAVLGPIVARMEHEEGRMRREFADTLWRLTGKPYGERDQAWAAWYEEEGEGFELITPEELEQIEEEEEKRRLRQVTQVEFFGIRIESTRVAFVIDVSGSMNETLRGEHVGQRGEIRMTVAKRELRKAVETMDATALYNIVIFSSGVDTWLDDVAAADEATREEAVEFIERLGAGGGTNLYEALRTAFEDPDVDTVVVLSDGEPSVGPVTDPGAILAEVRRWNEHRGVEIHCVSVGGSLHLLEDLAEEHGGSYVEYH